MEENLPEGFPPGYTLETVQSRSKAYDLLLKEAANLLRKEESPNKTKALTSTHAMPTHQRQLKNARNLLQKKQSGTRTPLTRHLPRRAKAAVLPTRKSSRSTAAKSDKTAQQSLLTEEAAAAIATPLLPATPHREQEGELTQAATGNGNRRGSADVTTHSF
ncbi:hypothetical protein MTO96_027556 [Rhipicephalus appendiculatus]